MQKQNNGMLRLFVFIIFAYIARCSLADARSFEAESVNLEDGASIGLASWYGPGFYKKATASGEIYYRNRGFVAHKTLPLRSCVRVTSLESGKSVTARVLDRGPYIRGRDIDLSYKIMQIIGGKNTMTKGLWYVLIEPVLHRECKK